MLVQRLLAFRPAFDRTYMGMVRQDLQFACSIGWSLFWSAALVLSSSVAKSEMPSASGVHEKEFECVIEPQQIVKLASPVVGVIARLDVDRGDVVRQGQIVGKLEDGVETATLALARAKATNDYTIKAAEARLQFLRRKHERLIQLYGKAASTLAAMEEADAEAKVAEQQLREAILNKELAQLEVGRAEEILSQRTLRSPIDGVVVERLLVPGEYRNEQSPVLTLAQINPLRVEVYVPTAHYGQIHVGSKAEIRPEQPIGGTHTASVTVVDHVLDAASGTFGVRLALQNTDLRLPAGIRCKASFETAAGSITPAPTDGNGPAQ
jgi:RND family efflux transporter MFP subunit